MAKTTLNKDGHLVWADGENAGKPVTIGEEPVEVTGVRRESEFQTIIARKEDEIADMKASLEEAKKAGIELPKLRDQLQKAEADRDKMVEEAKRTAQSEYEAQIAKTKSEAEKWQTEAQQYRSAYHNTLISNAIADVATHPDHKFIRVKDLKNELVPFAHVEIDKESGQPIVSFKMRVKDEKGAVEEKHLTAKEAAEIVAADPGNAHLIEGNASGGPSPGKSGSGAIKWSDLKTNRQKSEFIKEYGLQEFTRLRREGK